MESPYLTVPEVAGRWRCSLKTVYNMIDDGVISALRVGNLAKARPAIRILQATVEAYERKQLEQQNATLTGTNQPLEAK
jgi:excisionase family DNA binding protein